MKYYISDLHFGHKNVINFDNRPFLNTLEMEKTIKKRWNRKITDGDIVYILGDFCFGNYGEWERIASSLHGEKHLIVGNHDETRLNERTIKLFRTVSFYKEVEDCGRKVILSHYPILFYKQSYSRNNYMLHGHLHNRTEEVYFLNKFREDLKNNCSMNYGNIFNVGCMIEGFNYTPQSLDEILNIYGVV